jgi:hypothetical protein
MLELRNEKISPEQILSSMKEKTNLPFKIIRREDCFIFLSLSERTEYSKLEQFLRDFANNHLVKRIGYVYINEETAKEVCLSGKTVVRLKNPDYKQEIIEYAAIHNLTFIRMMHGTDMEMVFEFNESFTDTLLEICRDLENNDHIDWAEPDFLFEIDLHHIPNDPLFNTQWHLKNTGQSGAKTGVDIKTEWAWDNPQISPGGSSEIVIAIIDAGTTITLAYDYEGDMRPQDIQGMGGNGSLYDIGADEYIIITLQQIRDHVLGRVQMKESAQNQADFNQDGAFNVVDIILFIISP